MITVNMRLSCYTELQGDGDALAVRGKDRCTVFTGAGAVMVFTDDMARFKEAAFRGNYFLLFKPCSKFCFLLFKRSQVPSAQQDSSSSSSSSRDHLHTTQNYLFTKNPA